MPGAMRTNEGADIGWLVRLVLTTSKPLDFAGRGDEQCELLERRGGTVHDLSSSDLVDEELGKNADGGHGLRLRMARL